MVPRAGEKIQRREKQYRQNMNNAEIIYSLLEHIEHNLKNSLTVNDLSERSGFSLYYFSRLFKGMTGHSPKSYISGRKMTESLSELSFSDKKIIEIAYDYGFSTPESFSRAFNRLFGLNPSDVRRGYTVADDRLVKPVKKQELRHDTFITGREPELVELGPLKLIGISVYDENCRIKDLTAPWQNLMSRVSGIPARLRPERYYQVQTWFEDTEPELIDVFYSLWRFRMWRKFRFISRQK